MDTFKTLSCKEICLEYEKAKLSDKWKEGFIPLAINIENELLCILNEAGNSNNFPQTNYSHF
jgi:hypothetical protein